MSFEIEGKLIEKFDTQQISDSFKKREFVIETAEEGGGRVFTEQIKFQLIQDKCDLVDAISIDSRVKVSFNIKGRKWEKAGKVNYFTNLDAWRVESLANSGGGETAPQPPVSSFSAKDLDEEEDDLPF